MHSSCTTHADNSDYSVPDPFTVTFTTLTTPTQVSDSITISATIDNLFEDTERLQVMISDISSSYVMCETCIADIVFEQNQNDSKALSS